MSDYGLFESDEATQAEPRLAAKTAARKLEAAIDQVRSDFGRFLVGATGIDEFEDRWHLSKHDIRAAVEPLVFPNTGTMRRIKNALKQDWKLAHPYKLGLSHEEAGFGSMPTDDTKTNLHTEETFEPSSGNLIPEGDFPGYKNKVDQRGPEKVQNAFTPGGDSGTNKHGAKKPPCDCEADKYHGGAHSESCPCWDWEGDDEPSKKESAFRRQARDPRHYDQVGHEYTHINDEPAGSPEIMEDEGDHDGVHEYYKNIMEEPPAGYPRRERSLFEDEKPVLTPSHSGEGDLGSFVEDEHVLARREAAALVADIYTDFAQANGLRVASLDTLDHYASTGIAEADYRLLESMIVSAAEAKDEEAEEDSDDDDEADHEEPDADNFGGPSDGDEDNESDDDESDSDDDDSDDSDDSGDDEDYDFGGGSGEGGDDSAGGGQTYTVPDQAPELEPQVLNEIPHDDTDGSAPIPPEVVDSLLGLPPGTIEQLLLQEVEQGQGGAPQGGGDDFLGGGGGDADQGPPPQDPRMARRRQAGEDDPTLSRRGPLADLAIARQHADETGHKIVMENKGREGYSFNCPECDPAYDGPRVKVPPHGGQDRSYGDDDINRSFTGSKARQFWAAPDEDEDEMRARHQRELSQHYQNVFPSSMEKASVEDVKPSIQELYHRAQNGDRDAYGHLQNLYQERGWTAARRFWAADDDQNSGGGDPGGQQPPQGDPSQAGGDPAAMGGQPMMPPPGSQSVAPPQPPAPLENQPAEDALLDTANQAIMQMIDRETAEYQQIIGPLSQALQAVQFAQQVEQSEHPMDVTPPQGTVNVDPSQAPGGAGNPQQQLAYLMRQAGGDHGVMDWDDDYFYKAVNPYSGRSGEDFLERGERGDPDARWPVPEGHDTSLPNKHHAQRLQAKKVRTLKNAAKLIAKTFKVSEKMLIEAMGRRHYEHVAEAFQILPPEQRQDPYVRAAAGHIANMFAAENQMFNKQAFMDAVVGPASGSRLPFDRPRLAGETWKNTPTMDRFEFPNEQPEITDNMTINDLPKQSPKGLPKMKANQDRLAWGTKGVAPKLPKMPSEKRGDDVMNKYQRYTDQRAQKGLNFGDNDVTVENFLNERHVGQEAGNKLHESLGISHPPVNPGEPSRIKPTVPKAVNPTIKKSTWGEWEPKKEASFFTRRVPGWKWDDHLNGYISKEGKAFTCSCGQKVAAPSYKSCDCGKIWNVYAIGDTHHLASDTADMFIAREIPVRDNVIMANKKLAGNNELPNIHDHIHEVGEDGLPEWFTDPYEREFALAHRDLGNHEKVAQIISDHAYNRWQDHALAKDDENAQDSWYSRSCQADDYLKAVQQNLGTLPKEARRMQAKGKCECWDGYERVPGTEPCAEGSCRKCDSHKRSSAINAALTANVDLLATIDKLADWTKYDDDVDPAVEAYGKNKAPSTKVSQPPKDWATRLPKGDPSKKGGTWTPPTIPRKKK